MQRWYREQSRNNCWCFTVAMGEDRRVPPRHIALAVLVAVIWGANFVVIDLGLGDLPPTLFVALRFVVVLVPGHRARSRARRCPGRTSSPSGLFMSLGQFAPALHGAGRRDAGRPRLARPAGAGGAHRAHRGARRCASDPAGPRSSGVAVGAVGLGVVAVGRAAATPALGLVLVVAAATSWAVGNVAARRASGRRHRRRGRDRRRRPGCRRAPHERLRRRPVDDRVVGLGGAAAPASPCRWPSTARRRWCTP